MSFPNGNTKKYEQKMKGRISEHIFSDMFLCVLCGSSQNLQFDHIIPYSKGGGDHSETFKFFVDPAT